MELKDFLGKVVICIDSGERFRLDRITSPEIIVESEKLNSYGYHEHYAYERNPIANGYLVFEDPALKEPFCKAYEAYCHSEEGRWETYGYWLMKE